MQVSVCFRLKVLCACSASSKEGIKEAKQSVSAESSYPQVAIEQSHLNDSVNHQEHGAFALLLSPCVNCSFPSLFRLPLRVITSSPSTAGLLSA